MYSTQGLIPGTKDYQISETLAKVPGFGFLNLFNNPRVTGSPTPANAVRPAEAISPSTFGPVQPVNVLGMSTNLPSWEYLDSLPTGQNTGGNDNGSQNNSFGIIPDVGLEERLRSQRSTLDSILNRARGVYDEGLSALSSKRQQFKEAFDQGKEDILQQGQRAKGEAQTSAQGARTRNANALRALGLGGSALVNTKGREAQNEARTLAGINDQIGLNTRQNQGAYNTNLDWANAQESSLNRYLQDAQSARQAGENQINEGLFDYINNLASSLMAQATAGIGGYQVNPYQANIGDFTDSVNSLVSGITGGQEGNENVSIDPNYLSTIFKRLRGVQ